MVNKGWDLARLGLALPRGVLRRLSSVGIFVQAAVSLQYQHLAKRYVVRGVECGGAIPEIGRYVTFCGELGQQLEYLHPIDALGVNGRHAVVVGPMIVRAEMFRVRRSYELLVTKHWCSPVGESGRRPSLESAVLFRGVEGFLDLELWGKERSKAGTAVPDFYSRGGETMGVPETFLPVVQAAIRGVTCVPCSHSHFLMPRASSREMPGDLRSTTAVV